MSTGADVGSSPGLCPNVQVQSEVRVIAKNVAACIDDRTCIITSMLGQHGGNYCREEARIVLFVFFPDNSNSNKIFYINQSSKF